MLALMITVYVILDGFDLGVGIIHHLVGRNQSERQLALRSIGPVWDGNEVWLLAAGGTMFFAFPVLYASSFSGFYLPLMIVLWLLMLRGIGVELRHHIESPLWHSMWDFVFSVASALLAVFFGAAIGNVIRGVPLNSEKYFFEPLWTDFRPGEQPGILDWYTVLTGLVGLVALGVHGAHYLSAKTLDPVSGRAKRVASAGWWALTTVTVLSLIATIWVRPQMLDNYRAHWWGLILPAMVVVSLVAMKIYHARNREWPAFFSSAVYLGGMLGGAAFGLYPNVLPASTGVANNLTIHNTSAGSYGLRVGVVWWTIGMVLATGYFTYLYRSFRGKVTEAKGEGY